MQSQKMSHAVFITFPASGQMNPMLQFAKLLHFNGNYITFVVTNSIRNKRQISAGSEELEELSCFKFESIPDFQNSDPETPFDVFEQFLRKKEACADHFCKLLNNINSSSDFPDVTCIISDILMIFAKDVAADFDVPLYMLWTTSAADLLVSQQVPELIRRGYVPLKDENCLTNGYLDTSIDWIPGMKNIRLRDLSSFIRTTDHNDRTLKTLLDIVDQAYRASGLILHTFDQLEHDVLDALKCIFPRLYTVGPLPILLNSLNGYPGLSMSLSRWKEDTDNCKQWLGNCEEASVIYVSFGSLTTLTSQQLTEFAWGLADSNQPFLWIFRTDLVKGGISELPCGFVEETKGRGFLANWCHQVEILSHPSIGGFLTHGGWNSMTESITAGVPILCWPGFADQYTNCHYACQEWGLGLEIDQIVKREQVTELVRELMGGDTKQKFKRNAIKWKNAAEEACKDGGTSSENLKRLIKDLNP